MNPVDKAGVRFVAGIFSSVLVLVGGIEFCTWVKAVVPDPHGGLVVATFVFSVAYGIWSGALLVTK